jgi:molecular chaperone DnaJ
VLGANIKVPTTEGEKQLTIPLGIQSGTVLKMHDLGIPRLNSPNKRGNQLVKIIVETPAKITSEERKLFEQLEKMQEEKKEGKKKGFF